MTDTTTVRAPSGGAPGVRERILAAAMDLFYADGINVTGVDLIAARADVSKRTLYKYFPSKAVLVEQYLMSIREMVADPRAAQGIGPRERLMLFFVVPERGDGRMRGCPFHNASVEIAGTMPEAIEFVHLQKKAFLDAATDLCRDLGVDDPVTLGRRLALLYEGAGALSTSIDDVEPWACARATAEDLIDRATPARVDSSPV